MALAGLAALGACKKSSSSGGEVSRNWLPPQQESTMGVPAAEVKSAIQARLTANAPAAISKEDWKRVSKLYATFNQTLLWLDDKGVEHPRVAALLHALATADSDALHTQEFPFQELRAALGTIENGKPNAAQLADADVLLSTSFVAFGRDMLSGQHDPQELGQAWHINPSAERIDSALTLTLREDDLAAGLARMRPQDEAYDSLRVALMKYREMAAKGDWPTVPAGKALKRGDTDSPTRLAALRGRLSAEGFGTTDSVAKPSVFDRGLAGAVADFQAHHGIVVDSMLGQETVDAMNVPIAYRLAQIGANLERYRWMPRDLGQRYIFVNVPQFKLTAYDSGHKSLEMKVIVGKDYADRATPVFSDSMEYVIFRPYWNVTPSIAAKEIFPKEAASPGYIASQDMEVYNDHGRQAVRQRPGPKNALGFVKFIFPNDFNIYLHDTPNHELFDKDIRAFSHGCIRLEKPAELAQWVLGWTPDRVEAAMHGTDNRQINLPRKVPVYIAYFTTIVENGQLYFGNDLYDRDNKLVQETRDSTLPNAETIEAQRAFGEMAARAAK
jgi:murein L,D-transpeptidase YcbB/YkuD